MAVDKVTYSWAIGKDEKADKFYENIKNGRFYNVKENDDGTTSVKTGYMPFIRGELVAASALTNICNSMAESYDQIIEDQNDYIIELDTTINEISDLEEDLEAKIKKLQSEIDELQKKKDEGTITEEEEQELNSKTQELDSLVNKTNSDIDSKKDDIDKTAKKAFKLSEKERDEVANDYGNTAIDKGQPLSETQDKRKSFWRKTFGGWDKSKEREAGKKLIDAGNELLEQVHISKELNRTISRKTKNKK